MPGDARRGPASLLLSDLNEPKRAAWLTFAAGVMISVGCMRVVSAIYYFADSNRVNNVSHGPFAHHLIYWGFWDLLIAALALTAGVSLPRGTSLGGSSVRLRRSRHSCRASF